METVEGAEQPHLRIVSNTGAFKRYVLGAGQVDLSFGPYIRILMQLHINLRIAPSIFRIYIKRVMKVILLNIFRIKIPADIFAVNRNRDISSYRL